jgi:hypothetical protein
MRLLIPGLIASIVLAGAWVAHTARAEEVPVKELTVGDTPGAFALNDHDGKAVRLGSGEGHGWFVLAFYPKASTGG